MLRKKIYKWHRNASLVIAIPVLLWASSGFMHPVMTNIRPRVSTQGLNPVTVDSSKIKISLQKALLLNHIDSFHAVRLVHIDTNWFYQVQNAFNKETVYLSLNNGRMLKNGDWLYAQYIARLFLEGEPKKENKDATSTADQIAMPDCCDAASMCVLHPSSGAPVKDVSLITAFDEVYQSVNRLLPVYKVSFERADGIRVYVETTHDRFALAVDNKRAAFSTFFSLVHTWGWLNFLGRGRLFVEMFFAGLAFLTTLMGIYIFFISKSKKVNGNGLVKARRNHRYVSIVVSLFTLMFAFSGCYHAFSKVQKEVNQNNYLQQTVLSSQIGTGIERLLQVVPSAFTNIGLVKMGDSLYWQLYTANARQVNQQAVAKDLMKDKSATAPPVVYVSAAHYSILPDGDRKYASYLATQFSQYDPASIRSVTLVTKLGADYNFADKILPVWKVSYPGNDHERLYVETSSRMLSKRVDDKGMYEGYSFSFLHKHEFLGALGKSVKDFSTMFWAFAQIVMVAIGLTLYFKWRNRNKPDRQVVSK